MSNISNGGKVMYRNGKPVNNPTPTGTGAAGQNINSNNSPGSGANYGAMLNNAINGAKDTGNAMVEKLTGKFDASSLRAGKGLKDALNSAGMNGPAGRHGPSAPTASFSDSPENKDWRVKISIPNAIKDKNSPLLAPIADGFIFPYTPTIIISHNANYNSVAPIHNNYPFFAYQNSQVDQLTIVGQFYVQNAIEAKYWTACLHFLRAMTKMDYGSGSTGSPPPIAKLSGYGDYVFNNVPVVITNFTVDMPNEVDYISTGTGTAGGNDPTGNTSGKSEFGWAPAESQFSLTVQPIYSRDKQTKFSYGDFVKGSNLGAGYI
tara:strand:+ start:4298 stop:5254 length:957 start_codon:yes stop_codon:yes gene_type:complete